MAIKLLLDADKCRGYANCMIEAPEIWDFDDATDTAVLRMERPPEALKSKAEASVRGCPARAISIEETSD